MTITKKDQKKDWEADRKSAMAQSIKDSIEEEETKEEEEVTKTSQLINSGSNNTAIGHSAGTLSLLDTTSTYLDTSNITLSGGGSDSAQYLTVGNGNLSVDQTNYYGYEWEPKSNITTFELALSMPYLINLKRFYEDDPEMEEPFARHFKINID